VSDKAGGDSVAPMGPNVWQDGSRPPTGGSTVPDYRTPELPDVLVTGNRQHFARLFGARPGGVLVLAPVGALQPVLETAAACGGETGGPRSSKADAGEVASSLERIITSGGVRSYPPVVEYLVVTERSL
jgi:hypothetical protein